MDSQTLTTAAKGFFVPATFFLAGYSVAFSQSAVPELYTSPPHISTRIFKRIFENGAAIVPPLSLSCTISSGYLVYAAPDQRKLWIVAAAAVFSISPWTLGVMLPGIKRLSAMSEDVKECEKSEQTGEHRHLLGKWVAQNWVRVGMLMAAGTSGWWAILAA